MIQRWLNYQLSHLKITPSFNLLNIKRLNIWRVTSCVQYNSENLYYHYHVVFITKTSLSSKQHSTSFDIPGYTVCQDVIVVDELTADNVLIHSLCDFSVYTDISKRWRYWSHYIAIHFHYFLLSCSHLPKLKHAEREFVIQLSKVIDFIAHGVSWSP